MPTVLAPPEAGTIRYNSSDMFWWSWIQYNLSCSFLSKHLLIGFVFASWLSLRSPDFFLQSVYEIPLRNTWSIFIIKSSTLCLLISLCFVFRSLKSWEKYLILGSLSPICVSSKEISPSCASRPLLSETPQAMSWAPNFHIRDVHRGLCHLVPCGIKVLVQCRFLVLDSGAALDSWKKHIFDRQIDALDVCHIPRPPIIADLWHMSEWTHANGMLKPVIPLPSLISARCHKKLTCGRVYGESPCRISQVKWTSLHGEDVEDVGWEFVVFRDLHGGTGHTKPDTTHQECTVES